jgi:hypothetical protein
MWKIGAAFALLLAVGCTPLPAGVPLLNSDGAVKAVLDAYGEPGRTIPVQGVPSDCGWETPLGRAYGFMDAGSCKGGVEIDGSIWVVLQTGMRYSYVLCHEIMHTMIGDGKHRSREWDRVDVCNASIRDTLGEEDVIRW